MDTPRYDFVIVGSGFGGSVSALRLVEKGYRVLLLEKGRRFAPEDFPKTNWNIRRWLFKPSAGLYGFFQMSFLRHLTVLHGVGVGGGSLCYANTLPVPKDEFFKASSWGHLANWQRELAPHYETAKRMLGATEYPRVTRGDEVLAEIARDLGRAEHHHPTDVAVFFGEPGIEVEDPFFDGEGPKRTGCTHCGACMTGCRVGAKNTLDKNYLYLAEKRGLELVAETEVTALRPRSGGGFLVEARGSMGRGEALHYEADNVVLAGGVMGTVPLLLAMKDDEEGLPQLSDRVGDFVRTNSEALFGAVVPNDDVDFSEGVAITSILHTDEHSHVEPVRYGAGSGFFRTLAVPHAPGSSLAARLGKTLSGMVRHPVQWARAFTVKDFAKQSQILLYMRTLDSTLRLRLKRGVMSGFQKGIVSELDDPSSAPSAFMPEATDVLERFAEKVGGVPMSMLTETVLGVPTTAHILGGACMGRDATEGVIDDEHRVFGYPGLFVIDGSAVSANPGVNPSLTITALAERAMARISQKAAQSAA